MLDGLFGTGNGTTSTSINVGVIGLTKVNSFLHFLKILPDLQVYAHLVYCMIMIKCHNEDENYDLFPISPPEENYQSHTTYIYINVNWLICTILNLYNYTFPFRIKYNPSYLALALHHDIIMIIPKQNARCLAMLFHDMLTIVTF